MARISVAEGMTDALANPGEPGYVGAAEAAGPGEAAEVTPAAADELPPPPPVSAVKAEHVEYATEVLDVPAEQAESMTKPELVELAKQAASPLARSDS